MTNDLAHWLDPVEAPLVAANGVRLATAWVSGGGIVSAAVSSVSTFRGGEAASAAPTGRFISIIDGNGGLANG